MKALFSPCPHQVFDASLNDFYLPPYVIVADVVDDHWAYDNKNKMNPFSVNVGGTVYPKGTLCVRRYVMERTVLGHWKSWSDPKYRSNVEGFWEADEMDFMTELVEECSDAVQAVR